MTIEASYHGEVRFVRSSFTSKTGPTITLALHDIDELNRVQGMEGKRYMLALVEIGDDEQPVQKPKGGALAKLAGMWCELPAFHAWASMISGKRVTNSEEAAEFVRLTCLIQSRSELDNDELAEARFQGHIRGPFMKYMAGANSAPEWMEVA